MLAKFRVETTIIVSIARFLVVLLTVQLFFFCMDFIFVN